MQQDAVPLTTLRELFQQGNEAFLADTMEGFFDWKERCKKK